jgi:hypothetical protein
MTNSLFPEIEHPKQRAFLTAFRETGNVRLTCETAGIALSSHYHWLERALGKYNAFEEIS